MAISLSEYKNLLDEVNRKLQDTINLKKSVESQQIEVEVDTGKLQELYDTFYKLRNEAGKGLDLIDQNTLAKNARTLETFKQEMERVAAAYRNAMQAVAGTSTVGTEQNTLQSELRETLEILGDFQETLSGTTRFPFLNEMVNQALSAFSQNLDIALNRLLKLQAEGAATTGLDNLISRLQQGREDLDALAESGYLAGDSFKRLAQLAGNLTSTRGQAQLAQPLREADATLPPFFRGKSRVGEDETRTYRQLFQDLDRQRKALSGGAPIRMVDEETKTSLQELQQQIENLSQTFPSIRGPAREMQQVLGDIGQASVIGSEHATKFAAALQEVYKTFNNMARSPQTSTTQDLMRNVAVGLTEAAQQVFSDTGGSVPSGMQIPVDMGKPDVSVTWRHIGDYRESLRMLSQDGVDLAAITQDMVTQLANSAEAAGMAAAEIKILGGEINAADRSFALLYQSASDAGGAVQTFKSKQYFTAAGDKATPIFEQGVYDVSVSERISKEQLAVDKTASAVKDLYRRLNQEIRNAAQKAKDDLGPDVIIGNITPEVNEVTGAIEIVVAAIRKLDNGLTEPTEKVYRLQAALDSLAGTATISPAIEKTREESILGMFGSPRAKAAAKTNIQALLSGTFLSLEKDAQALYDHNAQLVRLSLSKRNLQGITEQLSITLDKNGKVVNDLRTRYSGFYQAIGQNIIRLTRWAFAANLVYAAMSKLQELPSFMGKLDATTSRLTEMTTLQRTQVQAFFNQLVAMSDKYAVSLTDSFAGSEKALQFTGGDTAKAARLIGDAMLYSKIAVVDLGTAIDTLSAALSQLGLQLDQGDVLMGKWIALSKQYGVSVNDLARAYGSAGSVAMEMLSSDVDIAVEEFNALITTTARVTTLTSDQQSNFLRTMMTNITSPGAISTLRRYGIEVETLGGGYRNVLDILKDVYYYTKLYQATSSQALPDISRAIGGAGGRQASRIQALIENIPLLLEVLDFQGDVDINLDSFITNLTKNLEGDINRLNTAFSGLLKTMGDEGLLDTFSNIVKILTGVVEAFTDLTKATDNAVVRVALMVPQFQALNALVGKLDVAKMKAFFTGGGPQGQILGTGLNYGQFMGSGQSAGEAFKAAFTGEQIWSTAGISIGMGVLSGINAAVSGKSATTAIATGVASAVGAAVGLALGGGPAGAFIGSQITSLVASAVAEGFERGARLADFRDAMGGVMSADKLSEDMIKQIFEQEQPRSEADIAKIAMALAKVPAGLSSQVLTKNLPFEIPGAAPGSVPEPESLTKARGIYSKLLEVYSGQRQERVEGLAGMVDTPFSKEVSARSAARQEASMLANVLSRQAQYEQNLAMIRKRSLMDLVAGNISLREYRDIMATIPTVSGAASAAYDILGDYAKEVGLSFDELTEILITGNKELTDYLSETVNQAMTYKSQISLGTDATKEYSAAVAEATEILGLLIKMQRESRAVDVPAFTRVKDYTQDEFMDQIYPLAQEYDRNKLLTYFFSNEDELRAMGYTSAVAFVDGVIEGLDPLGLVFKDKFGMIAGISSEAMQFAMQRMQEMMQDESGKFNIQRLKDVSPDKFGEIQKRNRYWLEYIAALRGMTADQLIEKEGQTFNLVMGEENVWKQLLSVNEAMNFTLQDILDIEKKQLEGMWNIPEGASFWVPITSLFYQKGKDTAYPDLPPLTAKPRDLEPTTTTIPKPSIPAAGEMTDSMRKRSEEMAAARSAATEGLAGISAMVRRFEDILRAGLFSPPAPGPRTLPDTYFGQVGKAAQQMSTVSIVLPQPEKITVESTATIQLVLNERVLASVVRTFLARETSRTIKNRTHTVPLGKL